MKKEPLLELIESLSSSEKRYISVNSSSESKYMILLSFIYKYETCDVKILKKNGLPKPIVKQFSSIKNYLSKRILSLLKSYNEDNDTYLKAQELLSDVRILLKKKLIRQAEKRIREAKKITEKYHFDDLSLKLLSLERSIVRNYVGKKSFERLEDVQEETQKYLTRLNYQMQITDVYDKLFLAARNKAARTSYTDEIISEFNELKDIPSSELSFEAYLTQQLFYVNYYQLFTNETDLALQRIKILIEYFESNIHFKQEHILRYVNLLNSYLNSFYFKKDFVSISQLIPKFKELRAANEVERIAVKQTHYHWKLLSLLRTNKYKDALFILPEILRWLDKNEEKISVQYHLILLQNSALVYFYNKEYYDSSNLINSVIRHPKQDVRQDISLFCKLLRLMIAFEEEDIETSDSLIRSLTRLQDFDENNSMINFVKEVVKLINNGTKDHFTLPQEAATKLFTSLKEQTVYVNGRDDILNWLESKV